MRPRMCLVLDRMANEGPASSLLALPDTCLVKVLQCCAADDQRNLFSAARAHSRLHQTAVAALRSLTAYVPHQQQVDGVLLYLGKAGRSIDSITLQGRERFKRAFAVRLRQLPPGLELTSLQLDGFHLQLQLGDGCMGVLGAAAPAASLTRLVLWHCELLDSGDATQVLAAAFAQLPAGLEHLSINSINSNDGKLVQFPTGALQRFDHLTYLQMSGMRVKGPDEASPALQPLEALTRLVELQIKLAGDVDDQVTPSMLAAAHHLTRLQLVDCKIQTGVLVGHTQLLHLDLHYCKSPDGAAGVAQLLAHLEPLQQLTHLGIVDSLGNGEGEGGTPPAAAYAALTAGSSLRDLDLRWCTLPPGVWQHVFPAGRQLQHLQSLDLGNVRRAGGSYYGPAPAGSLLVSCCPGLRSLIMQYLGLSGAETLGPLRGLTGLHTLRLAVLGTESAQGLQSVGELTGLRELTIGCNGDTKESILRRLTLLQQLTKLDVGGLFTEPVNLTCEVGG